MMEQQGGSDVGRLFLVAAAVIIVFAGIKTAAAIIVPFLLSLFIAIILMPALRFLIRYKIPMMPAMVLIVLFLICIVFLLGMLVGSAIQDFSANLPVYEASLRERLGGTLAQLESLGVQVPEAEVRRMLDPGAIFGYMTTAIKGFGSVLTNSFVILLTTVFMLLEGVDFRKKISMINMEKSSVNDQLEKVLEKINQYMALKALISIATGFLVYIMLKFFGLDNAILWGIVAFLLNFIPNIGSIIAAVPAVILAIVQLDVMSAVWIALSYVVINTLVGSVIEPRVMGRGLDLSTLVVFLSLLFWGWLLGPVGMLLSIPLTIMVKIAVDANPNTRWIAVMLGSGRQ